MARASLAAAQTWLFFVEIFKVIALFALFPAQLAWASLRPGRGGSIFVGIGMIISIYGGLIIAIFRGTLWLAAGRSPPKRRRRRR